MGEESNSYGLTAGLGQRIDKDTLITEDIVSAVKLDAADGVIIRENNIAAVQRALLRSYKTGLGEIGIVAEGYAKALCLVDTGRLRNSITHQLVGYSCYIETNVWRVLGQC